jgi:acyl-[acyl-carrier-protein]-phospholipid O-acyltransferase/long-chain-fatty-acid--[acyl-carrier-protein] ligase
MDAKTVGELAEHYKGSMLISTPTFAQSYLRRCSREQFAHLRYAIVGAEKLRAPLATAFTEAFGISLLEGYGCTEMSPVVAANVPDVAHDPKTQVGTKAGSVGHPIPGVAARIVDPETGDGPLIDREGLLLVKGPNLMTGYLNDPVRTAEAMRDGWYVTGDIARIDADGFIFITDRLSRFSKIGGEMVPHNKVEEILHQILGLTDQSLAVASVPDAQKGERLVVLHTLSDEQVATLVAGMSGSDLPNLWRPRANNFYHIDAIPVMATGKMDIKTVRQMAQSFDVGE